MLLNETTTLEVKCPRCGEIAGTVQAKLSLEYSSEYDDQTKKDKGSVKVEVVFKSESQARPWSSASNMKWVEHTCAT